MSAAATASASRERALKGSCLVELAPPAELPGTSSFELRLLLAAEPAARLASAEIRERYFTCAAYFLHGRRRIETKEPVELAFQS